MKKILLVACLTLAATAWADQVTFTCVNFSAASFSASAAGLQFANCVNVLVTDNSNGHSLMLSALDSGSTGTAISFEPGPPLIADYHGAGTNSVLVEIGGHNYLSGMMEDSGRLEAEYPDRAGAFLSRFVVSSVDPAILVELGTSDHFAPEGSVSLTLAQTGFDGTTLKATLGGAEYTIETVAPVAEANTMFLFGTGALVLWSVRKRIHTSI